MYIRRPCGCRCVQYSILGGKAQGVRAIFLRQWIFFFFGGAGQSDPAPDGGLPLRCRLTMPPLYPAGACPPCRLLTLPLACFIAPSPRPALAERSSRREGGDQGYFMQGASPLASPGLNPGGTGEGGEPRTRRVACPLRSRLTLPPLYPAGGLPSLPPAYPAFGLLFCPHPPDPLPSGKGETKAISCKGLRPLHPRAGWGRGTGFACGKPVLSALNRAIAHTGATGIRVEKSPLPRKGACVAGAVSAVDGLMPGCRGR